MQHGRQLNPAQSQSQPGPEKARTKARKQLSKSQASFKLQTKDVAGGAGMQGKRGSACGCSGTLVFPLSLLL